MKNNTYDAIVVGTGISGGWGDGVGVQLKQRLSEAGDWNMSITAYDRGKIPGSCIHETGTARMGKNPKTSVLNNMNTTRSCSRM